MNLKQLKNILAISEDPLWMTRTPDQQRIQTEEKPPMPQLPSQQPPQKPAAPNQQALQKAADQMLFGTPKPTPAVETSANLASEGGVGPSLSDSLKTRKLMRRQNPSFPGKIGIAAGGY